MAAFLSDEVMDQGLDYADTNGTRIDICSALPTSYANIAAVTLGNDTVNTGATEDEGTGRKVVVPAITAGSVTGTGLATHWALSDVGSNLFVAAQTLSSSVNVTSGNTFTLDAIDIVIPFPA